MPKPHPAPDPQAPAVTPPSAARRLPIALALALVLTAALVGAAHWPAMRSQALSFDDDAFVTYNPLVGNPSWTSVGRFFGEVLRPSTVKGYYLPLAMTSLMVDVGLGGRATDLAVFHRTALVLHVGVALLILLLLYELFGDVVAATIAALLFGLHPLTVEPIAWIGERKTLLATFFTLLSLLAYLAHVRDRRARWQAAALGCYVLALLSKPTVTMLPALLLILDAWPLRRLSWSAVREKWPWIALSIVSGLITIVSHERSAAIKSPALGDYLQWPVQAGHLLGFYLGKLAWPANLTSVYPDPVPAGLANPAVAAAFASVVLLTAVLIWLARRRLPGPLAGWLFFVVGIVPTLGVLKYSWVSASDKYVYFPVLGLLVALAAGIAALRRHGRTAGIAVAAIAVALLALEARGVHATYRSWSDSFTLYQHMEALAPGSPQVLNEFGILLAQRGRVDDSAQHLERAIAAVPGFSEAWYNLGVVRMLQGRGEDAIRCFRTASQLKPDDPDTIHNLGLALRLEGREDEAAAEFQRALRLAPRSVSAYAQVGSVLAVRGRPGEACDQFRQALAIAPKDPDLHFQLGSVLVLTGKPAEAVSELRAANRERRDWPEALNALAWLLATFPDPAVRAPEEALRLAGRASDLTRGSNPEFLDTVAAAQAAIGRFPEAIATTERAIALADEAGHSGIARLLESRLALYRRGVSYEERPGVTSLRPPDAPAPRRAAAGTAS